MNWNTLYLHSIEITFILIDVMFVFIIKIRYALAIFPVDYTDTVLPFENQIIYTRALTTLDVNIATELDIPQFL